MVQYVAHREVAVAAEREPMVIDIPRNARSLLPKLFLKPTITSEKLSFYNFSKQLKDTEH